MIGQEKSGKSRILNTLIDNISTSDLLKRIRNGGTLFTPNIDHLVKLQKDVDFYIAYQQADYIVCDSQILLWLSQFLEQQIQEKISGSDFFAKFYRYFQNDRDIKIFLLGGVEGVAQKAREKINSKINRPIVVAAHSPSIGFEKDEEECQHIIDLINNSGATVLAVGVGAPKQEKWIDKYKHKLTNVEIFLAIGAAIDFEAGAVKRAPKWMSNAGLEWLHRLTFDPKRLWRRYLVESLPFFWFLLLQKLNLYKFQPSSQLTGQNYNKRHSNDLNNNVRVGEKVTNVLMFGPCLSERGGMGSVQRLIVDNAAKELNINHITTWNGKSKTSILFFSALITLLDRLLKNQVDIVHLHVSERGSVLRKSILALISFVFLKPVIMHTHGCEFHIFYDNLPAMAQRLLHKVWQGCSRVIVLSKSWQNTYINKLHLQPHQVLVKYNPVSVPKNVTTQKNNSDKITFLLLGKINQRKGIFDLFEAIAQLPANYQKQIELIIAGSGEIDKAIALAQDLKIDSLVSFPGWVNTQQRDCLLKKADVFLLPSYNEGLPMALLEAMSWKLPAITTPVGGIPEIVIHKENGLLVEPGNIEELLESIQTLIDDESLRLSLGNAAYEKALLLDIENYSHEILNIYHSVMSENKREKKSRKGLLFDRY